jgi:hypothetical protein
MQRQCVCTYVKKAAVIYYTVKKGPLESPKISVADHNPEEVEIIKSSGV